MKLIYGSDYTKTKLTDLSRVENVLRKSGAVVDICLLPILQEAEKGDDLAMKELWEMFVHGSNNVSPNYFMAKRYQKRLTDIAIQSKNTVKIAQALINNAYMIVEFESDYYRMLDPILDAFRYMIEHCAFEDWDMEFFDYVQHVHQIQDSPEH